MHPRCLQDQRRQSCVSGLQPCGTQTVLGTSKPVVGLLPAESRCMMAFRHQQHHRGPALGDVTDVRTKLCLLCDLATSRFPLVFEALAPLPSRDMAMARLRELGLSEAL